MSYAKMQRSSESFVVQLGTMPPATPEVKAKARRNLAVMALDRPDSEAWLRDVLGALGLLERVA